MGKEENLIESLNGAACDAPRMRGYASLSEKGTRSDWALSRNYQMGHTRSHGEAFSSPCTPSGVLVRPPPLASHDRDRLRIVRTTPDFATQLRPPCIPKRIATESPREYTRDPSKLRSKSPLSRL